MGAVTASGRACVIATQLVQRTLVVGSALFIVLLAGLNALGLRDSLSPANAIWKDFGQDYLMARALADGIDPYLPMRDLAERYLIPAGLLDKPFPSPHPPSMALVALPLTVFDYPTAVRVWFVIEVVALLVAMYLICRTVGWHRWAAPATSVLAFALLAWPPLSVDLLLGQVTTVLLVLLVGAQLTLMAGHFKLAGILLGVSLIIKPLAWPWLLVVAYQRKWVTVGFAVGLTVLGNLLPALRIGLAPVLRYFTSVIPADSAQYATEVTNISWWTIGPRLFEGTSGLAIPIGPLISAPSAAHLVGAAVPTVVLAAFVGWMVACRPRPVAAWMAATGVALVVNPISWKYCLVLAVLPAAHLVGKLNVGRFAKHQMALAIVSLLGLALIGLDPRELVQQVSDWLGAAHAQLLPLSSLVALEPGLAAFTVAILAAVLCARETLPCARDLATPALSSATLIRPQLDQVDVPQSVSRF